MYLNLYLFAACFLPLITFRPARNNFPVGTNLATAQTLVDQPFNDEDQLFARDVSNYTNDYLERREYGLYDFSKDWSVVGKIENSKKHCVATNVGKGGYALTAAHCVHSGKAPLPGIKFTIARRKHNKIEQKSMTITSVIVLDDWVETMLPNHDIAVIHIEGYEPGRWMNMKPTEELTQGSKVDMMGVTANLSKMSLASGTITRIGGGLSVFELLTDTTEVGAPVYVDGDDDAPTIYGVISKWEEDDDDEGNFLHYSVAGITPDKLSKIQRLIGPI